MEGFYLIDADADSEGFKLHFYDAVHNKASEITDSSYKPYFFIRHPPSPEDDRTIEEINATTSVVEKVDLFTGKVKKVTKVELTDPADLERASKRFKESWEGGVPPTLSYVYDHDLTFGAPYLLENGGIKPIYDVPSDLMLRFEERFSNIKRSDSSKYELISRWFKLCSQSVPEVSLRRFGIDEIDPKRLYLTFTLSRVTNLPLPSAYSSRHVSVWIRSMLHEYLRRRNILIPRSRELRRGESKRSVQGALTFHPKTGIYLNTVVVDFESLYPSLIDAYNLSYETVNCNHLECVGNRVPGLNHHVCRRRRGVYSVLVGALKDLRIRWFKPLSRDPSIPDDDRHLAEAASDLLKLILVSSYGVTVRIRGLAQPALAESITAYGRHALQRSWNMAVNAGLRPIYGDTDSLFLDNPTEEQVNRLIRAVRERLRLDLAVDKRYSICVLPRAMKAYFGIRLDGTADVKGVVAIKSNSPAFIRNVFNSCVKELKDVKNWADFEDAKKRIRSRVGKAISNLKAGKIPLKDLEYTVRLHFDPSEKAAEAAALHQPYQCAVQLVDLGRKLEKGDAISFIKVKPFNYGGRTFTVKPTELVKSIREVNTEDYIRNLRTALDQTFKPMGISFQERKEASLTDFI
ncbi:MAG: DNA polymerase domain-containing protein [Candidatus Bathyarchaeia archaeon]